MTDVGRVGIWSAQLRRSRAAEIVAASAELESLGPSHAVVVERLNQTYTRPLAKTRDFLTQLDVPRENLVLGALGPKMLDLAREHTRGAHPYLTTVEHVADARQRLGADPLLAPELMVVLERDAGTARRIARQHLATYLALPNYRRHLLRVGLREDDLDGDGSDRLVDTVVAWDDDDIVHTRIAEFRDAGADHVCLQVLTADPERMPMTEWRALAASMNA